MAERLTTEQTRQGERRPMAMRALVLGTGLIIAAMAGILLWTYADSLTSYSTPRDASGKAAAGSSNGAGGGASSAQSGNVPGGNPSYPAPSVKNANQ